MAAKAQRQLEAHPSVRIEISRFEEWPLRELRFDLVLAATAFHWVDPAIRYVKSAAALKPEAALAIINTHHIAGGNQAFFVEVQACYEVHMPGTRPA